MPVLADRHPEPCGTLVKRAFHWTFVVRARVTSEIHELLNSRKCAQQQRIAVYNDNVSRRLFLDRPRGFGQTRIVQQVEAHKHQKNGCGDNGEYEIWQL